MLEKVFPRSFLSVSAVLTASFVPVLHSAAARAAPPATAGAPQIGIGFRYGQDLDEGDLNPWGTGLGAALGYTLPQAVYLGVHFDYFLGGELEEPDLSVSANYWDLMAVGGYDFGLGERWVLRPALGIGIASFNSELCQNDACSDESSSDFLLAPGAAAMYLSPSFSLSLTAHYHLVFAEETANAIVYSVGFGF